MKALKKKDSIMKKQNPQFTQKLLDNSYEPGAVEMRNKQAAQQRPSINKPSAADDRSGDVSEVKFLPEEGYRWDFCIQMANPDFDANESSDNPMNKDKPHDEEAWKNYEEIMERLFLGESKLTCSMYNLSIIISNRSKTKMSCISSVNKVINVLILPIKTV